MTLEQCVDLSRDWYHGRFEPDWEPFSVEYKQQLLAGVGLTGPFWKLAP